jgi:hypothetical protein
VGVDVARVVVCGSCGTRYLLSARNEREHRRRGTTPICFDCRHPLKVPTAEERMALRSWWLERYPRAELEEMAFDMWPELRPVPLRHVAERSAGTIGMLG